MSKTSIYLKLNEEVGYKFSTNYSNLIRMWVHSFLQLMPEWMWFSSCVGKETLNTLSPSHKNTFCLHSDSRNRSREEVFVTTECRWRWRQPGFTTKPVEIAPFPLLQSAGTVTVPRHRGASDTAEHSQHTINWQLTPILAATATADAAGYPFQNATTTPSNHFT